MILLTSTGDILKQTLWSDDGQMRRPTIIEIAQAHDLLGDIMDSEMAKELSDDVKQAMLIARDTLCYVLGHEKNPAFAENLMQWAEAYYNSIGRNERFDN